MSEKVEVYGIGNPLIDVLSHVSDQELDELNLSKGTMELIDTERGNRILAHIKDREKKYSCGGSAPNTMITLASLDVNTALAGMVGNDELGEIYHQRLEEKNVVSDLSYYPGDTGSCIVLITPDHERTMSTRLGVCQNFGVDQVNHEKISRAGYLYFTGYMWDTDSQKAALKSAIKTAKKSGTRVVFDVADPFAVERHRKDFMNLLQGSVDVVLANREEARLLLDCQDVEKAANHLGSYCSIAAVKDGANGSCIACHDDQCVTIDAFSVKAVDSTGAGDNYAAGFLYGLSHGYSLADAGRLASYIAAQVVQQEGAQFSNQAAKGLKDTIKEGSFLSSN